VSAGESLVGLVDVHGTQEVAATVCMGPGGPHVWLQFGDAYDFDVGGDELRALASLLLAAADELAAL
jgi:hypothetical protein